MLTNVTKNQTYLLSYIFQDLPTCKHSCLSFFRLDYNIGPMPMFISASLGSQCMTENKRASLLLSQLNAYGMARLVGLSRRRDLTQQQQNCRSAVTQFALYNSILAEKTKCSSNAFSELRKRVHRPNSHAHFGPFPSYFALSLELKQKEGELTYGPKTNFHLDERTCQKDGT